MQRYYDLKRYLGFGAEDEAILQRALLYVEPGVDEIVAGFYDRIHAYPEAAVFLPAVSLESQQAPLRRWLLGFFKECRDERYLQFLLEVKEAHFGVGIMQRYVVAGMNVLRGQLEQRIALGGPEETRAMMTTLHKALDLDLAVLVEPFALTEGQAQQAERRQSEGQKSRLRSAGILAAGLAHEIRNPLNGAQLHLTYLRRRLQDGGDVDVIEAIDVAVGEIKRLSAFLTELLAFAKPKPLELVSADLRGICGRAATELAEEIESGTIDFSVELAPEALMAVVDHQRVTEAISSMLRNSVEAMRSNSAFANNRLVLRAHRELDTVVVEIEDNGPGIPDSNAPVFEPFFTTKANSSGLGLAIAHRLVTEHDGHLTFSSASGRTVFTMKLPQPGPRLNSNEKRGA